MSQINISKLKKHLLENTIFLSNLSQINDFIKKI